MTVLKSSKETCSVSNKRPSKNTNKPRLYGRFVKVKRSSFILLQQHLDLECVYKINFVLNITFCLFEKSFLFLFQASSQTQENRTQESDDDSESEKDFSHL